MLGRLEYLHGVLMMAPQKLICFIGLSTLCLSLAACGTWTTTSVEVPPGAATTSIMPQRSAPSQIVVTENDVTDRPYKSLGDISVTLRKFTILDHDPTHADVNAALQRKAAEMGADAIIFVRYGTVGFSGVSPGQLDGNGRAIAFEQ